MATLEKRRSQNIEGDFYVDSTCIDCDTCRWMSPEVFKRVDSQSVVYHQPAKPEERQKALQALLSCPTASIGTVEKPRDIKEIQNSFPLLIDENVYHCGYHGKSSFGAASYFVKRPEGNILIDSPRFTPPLVKAFEEMGGIRWMYLTHKDDIVDHQKYSQHFGCDRILHTDEIGKSTLDVEIKLTGLNPTELDQDLLIIPVPGHTKGHTVLLYNQKFLFSGDHLAFSQSQEQLIGFPHVCWYSWEEQIESMKKLTNYKFEWILPGHGRRYHGNYETMVKELEKCILWMSKQ